MVEELQADSIRYSIQNRQVLSDIFIRCPIGQVAGLLGRNGSGKTSFLQILYGAKSAENKFVRLGSRQIRSLSDSWKLIAYLPQASFVPANFTVRRVLSDYGLSEEELQEFAPDFTQAIDNKMKHLSGGLRRMLECFIIIKSDVKFVFLDEPFTHLMPLQVEKILALIEEEKKKKGFLLTDHLYRQVISISDMLYILNDGKLSVSKDESDLVRLGYLL